tara:strand:- start:388 stop:513 length:126 start_codon:yes stop_codon:yes gene_type:complete
MLDFELLDIERLNRNRVQVVMKDKDGIIYRGIAMTYGEVEC